MYQMRSEKVSSLQDSMKEMIVSWRMGIPHRSLNTPAERSSPFIAESYQAAFQLIAINYHSTFYLTGHDT